MFIPIVFRCCRYLIKYMFSAVFSAVFSALVWPTGLGLALSSGGWAEEAGLAT